MGFDGFGTENFEGEFNQSLAIIYRLDGIAKLLIQATIDKNYEDQYNALLCYFKELSGVEKNDKLFEEQRQNWLVARKGYTGFLLAVSRNQRVVSKDCFDALNVWEIQVRRWGQKLGLGMGVKPDSRWAMAGKK